MLDELRCLIKGTIYSNLLYESFRISYYYPKFFFPYLVQSSFVTISRDFLCYPVTYIAKLSRSNNPRKKQTKFSRARVSCDPSFCFS
ncbi:unnamed protein product [Moneuplotes crassus]|uniref:Uncharacterized protein n=1 Tax=Euplotes crassus TaxID=5936 RepID=A0AAD1ULD0_EUPCR|nr:unnamed protein product [Moneuplotes crassus]